MCKRDIKARTRWSTNRRTSKDAADSRVTVEQHQEFECINDSAAVLVLQNSDLPSALFLGIQEVREKTKYAQSDSTSY
jgi:hypothetical protein